MPHKTISDVVSSTARKPVQLLERIIQTEMKT
jgi:hypothetical protein